MHRAHWARTHPALIQFVVQSPTCSVTLGKALTLPCTSGPSGTSEMGIILPSSEEGYEDNNGCEVLSDESLIAPR